MHLHADHGRSTRGTYVLDVVGGRATLVVTREQNAMARLDAWPEPWKLVQRTTFTGSFTATRDGAVMELVAGERALSVRFTCAPRTYQVLSAEARLVPKSADPGACHEDPSGTWVPPEKTAVTGLSCVRDGHEEDELAAILDMGPIELADGAGIEWVQENNGCFVFGKGYRHRRV